VTKPPSQTVQPFTMQPFTTIHCSWSVVSTFHFLIHMTETESPQKWINQSKLCLSAWLKPTSKLMLKLKSGLYYSFKV